MRTETRQKYEQIRAIRDDYNKQLRDYEKIAENEADRVIEELERIEDYPIDVFKTLKNIGETLEMLDIDDIIDSYVFYIENGESKISSIERVKRCLKRRLIG